MTSLDLTVIRHENVSKTAATNGRCVVVVVSSNKVVRDEFAHLFEQRGLRVGKAANCRAGISLADNNTLRAVIVIADESDRHIGALLNTVWMRSPEAGMWLIGNPFALRLSENVLNHGVAVLPPATTPFSFERLLFGFESAAEPLQRNSKPILPQRALRLVNRVEKYRRAKTDFEKRFLTRALQCYQGNISLTAKAIGMGRRNLQQKIQTFAIDIESMRVKASEHQAEA